MFAGTDQRARNKTLRTMTLSVAAVAAVLSFGLAIAPHARAQTQTPAFEVASIKADHSKDDRVFIQISGGRFTTTNTPAKFLIQYAYNLKPSQLSGGPSWISSEGYDVDAKEEDALAEELKKLPREQGLDEVRTMLQSLLADRFHLKVHHETKQLPVYALVVAKGGSKLVQSTLTPLGPIGTNPPPVPGAPRAGTQLIGPGQINATGVPIGNLADALSRQADVGRIVLDQTGLKGNYDFVLHWTPEGPLPLGPGPGTGLAPAGGAPDASGTSIFTAIKEQLGLSLQPTKGSVDTLVIDRIEEPSEN